MGLFGLFKAKWQHDDPEVRRLAVEGLKEKEQKTLKKIAVDDPEAAVRLAAVAKVSDVFLLAEISKNDADAAVRLAAVERVDDEEVLQRLLADASDEGVRLAAAQKLGDREAQIQLVCGSADAALFGRLAAGLADAERVRIARQASDTEISRLALEAIADAALLGEVANGVEGDPVADRARRLLDEWQRLSPHLDALENGAVPERVAAIEALAAIGNPKAVEPIAAYLAADAEEPLRRAAIAGLGRLGHGAAVEPLGALLKDSGTDDDIKVAVIEALAAIGEPQAADYIAAALRQATGFISAVRRSAVRVLGELGNPDSADVLVQALRNDDIVVQTGAVTSLVKLGDAAVEPLIRALGVEGVEGYVRDAQVEALEKISGQRLGNNVEKWRQWREAAS